MRSRDRREAVRALDRPVDVGDQALPPASHFISEERERPKACKPTVPSATPPRSSRSRHTGVEVQFSNASRFLTGVQRDEIPNQPAKPCPEPCPELRKSMVLERS